ncbi:hypothetical protein HL658_02595 [Azospirillum sp. RWY-5-1]|uniref:Transposase IS701-like DDE domain-containing protein n=1 Tax=Azospirillum oleiclasticum TaxID=2735135 RepID=A0ABX2T379_9PROT|nr:hypothetical protein [Azospirillum oleiclasticum]NYZ18586.1 hypothetical protein [Azospirillum oleiclasticum]
MNGRPWIATNHPSLPIAYRLYLSDRWAADAERRARAGIPDDVVLQTKPAVAPDQIRAAMAAADAVRALLGDRHTLAGAAREAGIAADRLPLLLEAAGAFAGDPLDLAERIELGPEGLGLTLSLGRLAGTDLPAIRHVVPLEVTRRGARGRQRPLRRAPAAAGLLGPGHRGGDRRRPPAAGPHSGVPDQAHRPAIGLGPAEGSSWLHLSTPPVTDHPTGPGLHPGRARSDGHAMPRTGRVAGVEFRVGTALK